MIRRLMTLGAAAGFAISLSACASTNMEARVVGDRPMDLSTTEASLWYQTDQAEERLRASGRTVEDPALNAFVHGLICEISGPFCADLRLYVVDTPDFNASMAPNGMAVVNTGLLIRAETVDELAFVLGHEFVHFEENHFLERHAAIRNANITSSILGSALAAAGGGAFTSLTSLAAYSGAANFSQDQESEADSKGLDYAVAAGYSATAGAEIWSHFLAELSASDLDAVRNRRGGGILGTHPHIERRIEDLTAQAETLPSPEQDQASYRALIRPHLHTWLADHVVRQDHGATLVLIDRLSEQGTDLGVLLNARGRVLVLRGDEGDTEEALETFQTAATHDDAPADVWRSIAEIHRQAGRHADAAAAFQSYLDRAPDARDRALIESLIIDLTGTSS
jgi:beta-barrel assembly-enhancing protease